MVMWKTSTPLHDCITKEKVKFDFLNANKYNALCYGSRVPIKTKKNGPNDLKHWKRFICKITRLNIKMSSGKLKQWQWSPRSASRFDTGWKDEQTSKTEFLRNRNSLPKKNYDKKIKEQLASCWKWNKEQKNELARGAQNKQPVSIIFKQNFHPTYVSCIIIITLLSLFHQYGKNLSTFNTLLHY